MKYTRSGKIYAAVFTAALTLFTAYALLDTFVIPRTYEIVAAPTDAGAITAPALTDTDAQTDAQAEAYVDATTYRDADTAIILTTYRVNDTTVYVADVTLSGSQSIKTAFAEDTYGKNVKDTVSDIAAENGAILAINGDFYGARNSGYVIRDGVLYRSRANGGEDLVIWSDGSFGIVSESDVTAAELLADGARHVFSFGPALISDGEIAVSTGDEVGLSKESNPRTAIGVIGSGHYLFVVSDGRTDESAGLSLYELAEFMKDLGATVAYNLDGGGSSTMIFNGELINNPTFGGGKIEERSVSDIVYIG